MCILEQETNGSQVNVKLEYNGSIYELNWGLDNGRVMFSIPKAIPEAKKREIMAVYFASV